MLFVFRFICLAGGIFFTVLNAAKFFNQNRRVQPLGIDAVDVFVQALFITMFTMTWLF